MELFGGKKKEERELPTDRVHIMMRGGMSEKDIVRQLKAEGYSFGEIEKALMAVVKEGAAPLPLGAELGARPVRAPVEAPLPLPRPKPAEPAEAPAPAPVPAPTQAPQYVQPSYQPAPAYFEFMPEELEPEVVMEELIESVAEEKFEKFSEDVKHIETALDKLRSELAAVREKAAAKPAPEVPKELSDRIDELEVRLGGLEKAFKQILPQLTESIQAISKMVAEKKRQAQY